MIVLWSATKHIFHDVLHGDDNLDLLISTELDPWGLLHPILIGQKQLIRALPYERNTDYVPRLDNVDTRGCDPAEHPRTNISSCTYLTNVHSYDHDIKSNWIKFFGGDTVMLDRLKVHGNIPKLSNIVVKTFLDLLWLWKTVEMVYRSIQLSFWRGFP